MKLRQLSLGLLIFCIAQSNLLAGTVVESSRDNTVRINVPSLNSSGTGFFVDAEHVATAFHVVGKVKIDKTKTPVEAEVTTGSDVSVILPTGETISAQVVAPNGQTNVIKIFGRLFQGPQRLVVPVLSDFAILKLKQKPKKQVSASPLLRGRPLPPVGTEILFSGYPLRAPTMLTHKGIISGITADQDTICIEAPINKGNSGGALLDEHGNVIGIITKREGGVSNELNKIAAQILETKKQGSVAVTGVNQADVIEELIATLQKYISPGIGYARNINHLVKFIDSNPDILN